MEKVNSQFVMLYNVFRDVDSEYHLSVDELYLYSLLKRLINRNNETVVNVDILEQYSNIPFHSRPTEGKRVIKKTLLSLKEKGVIYIDSEISKNNQLLRVTFEDDFDNNGHEQINFSDFDAYTDKTLFYIYFVVASWKKVEGGFVCSYNRWADILSMTPTTAKKYVDSAIDKDVIYCSVGDYSDDEARSGQKTRNPNQYSIYPFTDEQKTNMQKKQDKEDDPTPQSDFDDDWGSSSKYPFDTGNWLNRENLDVEDYIIYLEHKDKIDPISKDFVADCKKKIKRINDGSKGKFKYIHEKNMEQAQEKIIERRNENQKQQANDILINTNDVALLVNDKIISYGEWNGQDTVNRVYYRFGDWVSIVDDHVEETRYVDVSDNEEVELHRPDENGEWDNDTKKHDREMRMEMEMEREQNKYKSDLR